LLALIDYDIVTWRVGFAAQETLYNVYSKEGELLEENFSKKMLDIYLLGDEDTFEVKEVIKTLPWNMVVLFCDNLIKSILKGSKCKKYVGYMGGKYNFRKFVDKEYKANRKGLAQPELKERIRHYLLTKHKGVCVEYVEADDAMGVAQGDDTIICSIDKDMLQIPGMHYNIVNETKTEVSEEEALKFLYKQMLMGDTADNITGIRGIGPKKADKLLNTVPCWEDAYQALVLEEYVKFFGEEDAKDKFLNNYEMLYILREPEEQLEKERMVKRILENGA